MNTVAAVLILLGVLAFAVARPRGLPEVVAAAPAALLVIAMRRRGVPLFHRGTPESS